MVLMAELRAAKSCFSSISRTSGLNDWPWSYTCAMVIPYVKGEMFNMLRSVASDAPTLLPASTSLRSVVISIVPRAILVGTPRAWKKEVLPGSIPVLPAGMKTSRGATAPALAGAATLFARIFDRVSLRSPLVKINPTLPVQL